MLMVTRMAWRLLIPPLPLAAVSCGVAEEYITGSGRIVSREHDVEGFDRVRFDNFFHVNLQPGDSHRVVIKADDNLMDRITVEQTRDGLRIGVERGLALIAATLTADIEMPVLRRIQVEGASKGDLDGFRSDGLLEIEVSGASRLEGAVEVGTLKAAITGASRLKLAGSGNGLTLRASGASSVDLSDFAVPDATVTLSGASEATVRVERNLGPIDLSGSSRLRYKGDPEIKQIKTSGASTVGPE